jgi:hypothetical protein
LGNMEAAENGPGAYSKRLVRRNVLRRSNKVTNGFRRRLLGSTRSPGSTSAMARDATGSTTSMGAVLVTGGMRDEPDRA